MLCFYWGGGRGAAAFMLNPQWLQKEGDKGERAGERGSPGGSVATFDLGFTEGGDYYQKYCFCYSASIHTTGCLSSWNLWETSTQLWKCKSTQLKKNCLLVKYANSQPDVKININVHFYMSPANSGFLTLITHFNVNREICRNELKLLLWMHVVFAGKLR